MQPGLEKEQTQIKVDNGIYLLEIYSSKKIRVGIKKFSEMVLTPGFYYYAGSAQKNLQHRILRHTKKGKTIHWHIDHLTSKNDIQISQIFVFPFADKDEECKLVKNLEEKFGLNSVLKGFGNSDCNSCKSHILYSKTKIDQSQLFSLYQSMVLFNPSSREISG